MGFSGPLVHALDDDLVDTLAGWHEVNFSLLLALVALHIGTVLYYWLRRGTNLVRPMLDGGESSIAGPVTPAWLALLVIAVLGGMLFWLLSLAPEPPPPFL